MILCGEPSMLSFVYSILRFVYLILPLISLHQCHPSQTYPTHSGSSLPPSPSSQLSLAATCLSPEYFMRSFTGGFRINGKKEKSISAIINPASSKEKLHGVPLPP